MVSIHRKEIVEISSLVRRDNLKKLRVNDDNAVLQGYDDEITNAAYITEAEIR